MRFSLLVASALVLSGCSAEQATEVIVPAPVVDTMSVDGIDELAFDAFRRYLAVSAAIAADGGTHPERIADVVTAAWLPEELSGFQTLTAMGAAQVGSPVVTKIEVAAVRGIAAVSEVIVHACTAFDGVAIRSGDGTDVPVTAGTTLVTVYVVPVDGVLRVDGVEPWADASWCDEA